jgi:hypothetical protein
MIKNQITAHAASLRNHLYLLSKEPATQVVGELLEADFS